MSQTVQGKPLSARLKVERAEEHIADLGTILRAFFDTKPYEIGTKRDPDTRKLIYYMARVEGVPARIPLLAGEVIHSLRSALDHLAFAMAKASPITDPDPKWERKVYFPIGSGAAKYQTNPFRKIQGMRQDFINAVDAVQPYKGGAGHRLWVLNELNNADKHRLLITVGSAFRSINLGAHTSGRLQKFLKSLPKDHPMAGAVIPVLDAHFGSSDKMCPLKAGDELFVDTPDAEVNEKMDFRFEIAFNEPKVIEGEPLIETLHEFAKLVGDIVAQIAPLL